MKFLNKILNYLPENPKYNGWIAGPSLIVAIALLFPYGLGFGARAFGVVLLAVAVLASIRLVKQWNKTA
jgi:hypothetical protein